MRQPLLALLGATAALALSGNAAARCADGDDKETVESRLLRILKDRGVLSDAEFGELSQLAARMRAEESVTSVALDREITELAAKLAAQAPKSEGPTVGYKFGKGMTVSQGDDFSMTIGGYFQPRFSYINPDGPVEEGGLAAAAPKNDNRATFEVRRAELGLEGNVLGKDTTYKVVFDASALTNILRDAWVDHRFDDAIHLRFGQMRVPTTRANYESSSALQFMERAAVSDRFRSLAGDRDDGLMAWGELEDKHIEWYAGVFNGEGLNNGNVNPPDLGGGPAGGGFLPANSSNNDSSGLLALARVMWNPFGSFGYIEADVDQTPDPKLQLGAVYSFNPERRGNPLGIAIPAGTLPVYDVSTYGASIAFKQLGWFFQGEAFYRQISAAGSLESTPGHFLTASETGWYAQGGYFIGSDAKGVGPEVAARFSTINFDNSIAPAVTTGGTNKVDDYTVGFNYYFDGHNLKFQTDYTYRVRNLTGLNANDQDQIFRMQIQLKF